MSSTTRAIAVVAVVFWTVFGVWAFASPATFYEHVARYPPFNAHFLRDAGAFQVGVGAGVAAALRQRSGIAVALIGTAVAGFVHFVAHVIDAELGGSAGTTAALGLLAALFVAGAAGQGRRRSAA